MYYSLWLWEVFQRGDIITYKDNPNVFFYICLRDRDNYRCGRIMQTWSLMFPRNSNCPSYTCDGNKRVAFLQEKTRQAEPWVCASLSMDHTCIFMTKIMKAQHLSNYTKMYVLKKTCRGMDGKNINSLSSLNLSLKGKCYTGWAPIHCNKWHLGEELR